MHDATVMRMGLGCRCYLRNLTMAVSCPACTCLCLYLICDMTSSQPRTLPAARYRRKEGWRHMYGLLAALGWLVGLEHLLQPAPPNNIPLPTLL